MGHQLQRPVRPSPSFPQKPQKWVSPAEKTRLKAERALEAKKRQKRCDELRYRAIIKKFGLGEAIHYGVPLEYINRVRVAVARTERREQKRADRHPQ